MREPMCIKCDEQMNYVDLRHFDKRDVYNIKFVCCKCKGVIEDCGISDDRLKSKWDVDIKQIWGKRR